MVLSDWQSWRSLTALQKQIQRLVGEVFQSQPTSTLWVGTNGTSSVSSLQLQSLDTQIILSVKIPIDELETLSIQVTPETVLLSGIKEERVEIAGYCNFAYPAEQFQNLIPLPHPVMPEVITTEWQGNVLTITLLKQYKSDFSYSSKTICLQHPWVGKTAELNGSKLQYNSSLEITN